MVSNGTDQQNRRAMIRYDLKCDAGHVFDAWFPDSAGFEAQREAGSVACPVCGDTKVAKCLMAPAITKKSSSPKAAAPPAEAIPTLSAKPETPLAAALAALRKKLETEATYVGRRFPEEARQQHESGDEGSPVWGEASPAEAEALLEDGIPIAPLPPLPRRDD